MNDISQRRNLFEQIYFNLLCIGLRSLRYLKLLIIKLDVKTINGQTAARVLLTPLC